MTKKIMVTGAGGFVGEYLTQSLLDAGYEVNAFDFNPLEGKPFDKCNVFKGDIRNEGDVEKACKGCDSVIHLAAVLGSSDYQFNYDIHVKGSENVIKACEKHGIKRVVAFSSVAAKKKNPGHYGATKKMSEDLFMKSGLDITIIRPTMVLGIRGKGLLNIVKQVRAYPMVIPLIGSGKATRQPAGIKDMVKATILALESKKSYGKAYDIGGSEVISFKNFVKAIRDELGIEKTLIPIPAPIAKILAKIMEKVLKKPPFTYENVRNLTINTSADITPAKNDFGYTPNPFRDTLHEIISELK